MGKEPILCYINGPWAYFTTQSLQKQWGDDWDDKPYEHNAGNPYGPCWHNDPILRNDPNQKRGWKPGTKMPLEVGEQCYCVSCSRDWSVNGNPMFEIIKIAWDGDFVAPCDWYEGASREWSVRDINNKCVPWLRQSGAKEDDKILIWAGTKLSEFKKSIRKGDGDVYVREDAPG